MFYGRIIPEVTVAKYRAQGVSEERLAEIRAYEEKKRDALRQHSMDCEDTDDGQTCEYLGYTYKISQDNYPENPRTEFDNACHMAFFHREYDLGDKDHGVPKPGSWEYDEDDEDDEDVATLDLDEEVTDQFVLGQPIAAPRPPHPTDPYMWIALRLGGVVIRPVWLLDHSGLYLRLGNSFSDVDPGEWDSGILGFAFITKDDILREGFQVDEKGLAWARNIVEAEFEIYAAYVENEVYGYEVEDPEGNDVDSCWGFYGEDGMAEAIMEARSAIESAAEDIKVAGTYTI
jgi:hypothetical protein